ncbi:hypothetical protein MPTK1_2g25870 [Marchantia polymorpha subsp. ruderalis]|nr:hypothetical protein Mp_2g25870 [Marchantia polymorpha subsp. ruderalis]
MADAGQWEVARTLIKMVAICTTLFVVTDYATMFSRFCYRVYTGGASL